METVKVSVKSHNNINFVASLSNGETIYEGKGDFCVVAGELSPWMKLVKYIEEKSLDITSLSLYGPNGRVFNLPSAGKNPKFKIFDIQNKPKGFKFFRKAGSNVGESNNGVVTTYANPVSEVYTVIEAVYDNYSLQLWVSDEPPFPCWALVVEDR